jgi:uncharacterized damage-inducible protein DinB
MIETLLPVAGFLQETHEAIRISIDMAGEAGLAWKPAQNAHTFGEIVEHIASGNLSYATVIGPENVRRTWEIDPAPQKEWLLARLNESLETALRILDGVTEDILHIRREYDWNPNCEEQTIREPLDALWFAQQMVRHAAYHLGQINLYLRLMGIGKYD